MISKTTLLTGIAGLMFVAAPAFAQDAMAPAPQTPPANPVPQTAAPATPAAPAAQPGTISLQPGSEVKGSDGAVLGKLEGVHNNAAGEQELTVRGSDGTLRGVPLGGLKPEGTGVSVAWTSAEYMAAPGIAGAAPAPAAAPATPAADAMAEPTDPAAAPASTPPTTATDPADADAGTAQEPTTPTPTTPET